MKAPRSRRNPEDLAGSGQVLLEYLDGVDFEIGPLDFFLLEFARLDDEGKATFEDPEFRDIVRGGVGIHVNPNERIRAAMARALVRARGSMKAPSRRLSADVIAAVENTEYGLEDVPAVVAAYTFGLVQALEFWTDARVDPTPALEAARSAISEWTNRTRPFSSLREELDRLGDDATGAIADMLLESPEDESRTGAALDLLAERKHPVAARALAFAISEPLLGEAQERRALALAEAQWPLTRPFVLYHLRRHAHDDIPFRWLELLVNAGEPRAVDRVLEELAVHAHQTESAEDLRAILDLLARSSDPGLEGKIVRFMTNAATRPEALDLLEEWVDASDHGSKIQESLTRWNEGIPVLVTADTDFMDFSSSLGIPIDDGWTLWVAAYHESLGWQRYSRFPRTTFEEALDRELVELVASLTPTGRVDPSSVRPLVEDARERRLLAGHPPELGTILKSRRRDDPWAEAAFRREINSWFIRAAAASDDGDTERAIRILEVLVRVDPKAPLPRMLAEFIREN